MPTPPAPIYYRLPETLRLELPSGGWILVKKYLTAGETRRVFRGMLRRGATGDEIDPLNVGLSKCLVYLVDWSVVDANGNPVVIRGQSEEHLASMLDSMDYAAFGEILRAVEAHEDAMEAARAEEKKTRAGSTPSSPTSPSPAPSDGATSGSLSSIATSTASSSTP